MRVSIDLNLVWRWVQVRGVSYVQNLPALLLMDYLISGGPGQNAVFVEKLDARFEFLIHVHLIRCRSAR